MTSTMKAAVKLKPAPGSTEARKVAIPEPTPTEVLIRVDIASICGTDVHIYDWDAWEAVRIKVPLVQGHEFAGHIENLGYGGTGLREIGLMAVALCRGMAARSVIAIGHKNQYRMDLAKKVGASVVLRSGESLVDQVMDATAGEGVDEVLEFSGSEGAVQQAIKVVRPAGGIHLLGLFPKPLSLDISDFVTRGLSLYGIHGRLMYKTWMQMGGLLKSGNVNLKPILTHKFPLDDYNEAMGVMRSGNCGKVAFPMAV